ESCRKFGSNTDERMKDFEERNRSITEHARFKLGCANLGCSEKFVRRMGASRGKDAVMSGQGLSHARAMVDGTAERAQARRTDVDVEECLGSRLGSEDFLQGGVAKV